MQIDHFLFDLLYFPEGYIERVFILLLDGLVNINDSWLRRRKLHVFIAFSDVLLTVVNNIAANVLGGRDGGLFFFSLLTS